MLYVPPKSLFREGFVTQVERSVVGRVFSCQLLQGVPELQIAASPKVIPFLR